MLNQVIPTIRPLPKQHLAWEKLQDKVTKYLLFGGGAGGGKSWLGCEWLLVMCETYPNTKWFIGRKELKRLMQSSFETWKKVCKHHNIPDNHWKLNGQYNYIEFFNGSKIDLLDLSEQPSDPLFERFGSTEYTGGWIEEAGEIVFKAFDVLKTRIGRQLNREYDLHPKLLLTCNPKKNWLKRLIWKPWINGVLESIYAYVQSLYSDNVYTAETYGESLNEITDKATRQRLKNGNWDYDDDEAGLVDNNSIQDIWTNSVEVSENRYATIDVARFGKDSTKMYLWRGLECYRIIKWEKQDTGVTATKAKEILAQEKIPYSHTIIDEVGVGGGVIDQMKGCVGFIANSSPLENPSLQPIKIMKNGKLTEVTQKENFSSLKDQCGYVLAERINSHKIHIITEDESLKEQIEEEISELKDGNPDGDGKKKLVSKEDIKENIGRSPDDLDNLIMRMWFELSPVKKTITNPFNNTPTVFR